MSAVPPSIESRVPASSQAEMSGRAFRTAAVRALQISSGLGGAFGGGDSPAAGVASVGIELDAVNGDTSSSADSGSFAAGAGAGLERAAGAESGGSVSATFGAGAGAGAASGRRATGGRDTDGLGTNFDFG